MDVAITLREIADECDAMIAPSSPAAGPPTRLGPSGVEGSLRTLVWIPIATTRLFAAVWLSGLTPPWRTAPPAKNTALRLTPLSFEQGGQTGAVWSPEGKAVAFGARQKGTDPFQIGALVEMTRRRSDSRRASSGQGSAFPCDDGKNPTSPSGAGAISPASRLQ